MQFIGHMHEILRVKNPVRYNHLRATVAFSFGLLIVMNSRAAGLPRYHVTNLGDLPGGTDYSFAYAINARGQVAGVSRATDGQRAVVWSPTSPNGTAGSLTRLADRNGSTDVMSLAAGMNDNGQIVGYGQRSGETFNTGFLWTPDAPNGATGTFRTFPLGTRASTCYAINNTGQICGTRYTQTSAVHPTLWTPIAGGGYDEKDLGDLPGGNDNGYAYALNQAGRTVGESVGTGYTIMAFVWTPTIPNGTSGSMLALGLLSPTGSTMAYGINEAGWTVGESYSGSGTSGGTRGFLWKPNAQGSTALTNLGELPGGAAFSIARDVNTSGQVVGFSDTTTGWHAFIWTETDGMVDLNTLLDASGTNCVLSQARAINDLGQIACMGDWDSDGPGGKSAVTRGFLLTPLPDRAGRYDFDGDGVVDQRDIETWQACFTGPALTGPPSGCAAEVLAVADSNHDGDVDQADFAALQVCFGSKGTPTNPDCKE